MRDDKIPDLLGKTHGKPPLGSHRNNPPVPYVVRRHRMGPPIGDVIPCVLNPVIANDVAVHEVSNPVAAQPQEVREPATAARALETVHRMAHSPGNRGAMVRRPQGHRVRDTFMPLSLAVIGFSEREGAVHDESAHRVADEDEPFQGHRPTGHEVGEQAVEISGTLRHPKPGVVPHEHGGETQVAAQPGRVRGPVGRTEGPRSLGLEKSMNEDDDVTRGVGVAAGETFWGRVDPAMPPPQLQGGGEFDTVAGHGVTVQAETDGQHVMGGRSVVHARPVLVVALLVGDNVPGRSGGEVETEAHPGIHPGSERVLDVLDRAGDRPDGVGEQVMNGVAHRPVSTPDGGGEMSQGSARRPTGGPGLIRPHPGATAET